jgi:hypothetical protein
MVGYQSHVLANFILSSIELNLKLFPAEPGTTVERKTMTKMYNLDDNPVQPPIRCQKGGISLRPCTWKHLRLEIETETMPIYRFTDTISI